MKKTMFFVSAIVALSMGMMFTACSNDDEPTNGCKCTFKFEGESFTENFRSEEIEELSDYYGFKNTCSGFESWYKQELRNEGDYDIKVSCKNY